MKPGQLVLRCYAERDDDGSWFAICLDLNIYARDESFERAHEKLQSFIVEYLQEAVTVDVDYVEDLVPRRAPAYFWLKYYSAKARMWLRHAASRKRPYKTALPMVPAAC